MINLTPNPRARAAVAALVLIALLLAALLAACSLSREAPEVASPPEAQPRVSSNTTHFTNLAAEDLTLSDDVTIGDDATVTGDLTADTAAIGGGYGSTGCTVSTAGVLQCNGAATTDGALTAASAAIGGGYGSSGCSVSAAGVLQCNGAATTDGALTADSAAIGGGYGATGCSVSNAGVLQCNGAATTDGALTADSGAFGGGYGSTGCTISTAGVLQCNGAATTDGAITAASAAIGGGYGSTGCSISAAGVLQCDGAATLPSITLSGDITLGAASHIYHGVGTGEGIVFAAYITTTYGTTTTTSVKLPANADVIDWSFVVQTAYNDSGTDLMVCGTAGDPDMFVDDLDVSSAGRNLALDAADMQQDEATWGDVGAATIDVLCTYTGQNSNASAGAGRFIIWYRLD